MRLFIFEPVDLLLNSLKGREEYGVDEDGTRDGDSEAVVTSPFEVVQVWHYNRLASEAT